jgi:flagellar basal body rod protein FlgG
MNISSNAALSGVQTALYRHDVSANDIANMNTPGYEQVTPQQTETLPAGTGISNLARTPNDSVELSNTDLATEMVEQKTNGASLSANIAVLKAQDKMTGELLDLFA